MFFIIILQCCLTSMVYSLSFEDIQSGIDFPCEGVKRPGGLPPFVIPGLDGADIPFQRISGESGEYAPDVDEQPYRIIREGDAKFEIESAEDEGYDYDLNHRTRGCDEEYVSERESVPLECVHSPFKCLNSRRLVLSLNDANPALGDGNPIYHREASTSDDFVPNIDDEQPCPRSHRICNPFQGVGHACHRIHRGCRRMSLNRLPLPGIPQQCLRMRRPNCAFQLNNANSALGGANPICHREARTSDDCDPNVDDEQPCPRIQRICNPFQGIGHACQRVHRGCRGMPVNRFNLPIPGIPRPCLRMRGSNCVFKFNNPNAALGGANPIGQREARTKSDDCVPNVNDQPTCTRPQGICNPFQGIGHACQRVHRGCRGMPLNRLNLPLAGIPHPCLRMRCPDCGSCRLGRVGNPLPGVPYSPERVKMGCGQFPWGRVNNPFVRGRPCNLVNRAQSGVACSLGVPQFQRASPIPHNPFQGVGHPCQGIHLPFPRFPHGLQDKHCGIGAIPGKISCVQRTTNAQPC